MEGDKEISEQLSDVLKKLTNGHVRRSIRSLDQLNISERRANQPDSSAPEATRGETNGTADALVAAMQRAREAKSKE